MLRAMLKDGSWIGLLGLAVIGFSSVAMGVHMLKASTVVGMSFVAVGGLALAAAFLALRHRKRRYGDGPTTDEREQWIRMRGDNAGALALMIYWSLACLVPLVVSRAQHEKTISIDRDWLMLALMLSFGLFSVVRTAVIRHIRKRELSDGQG